jgi:type I restriction enzyme M protein
MLPLIVLRRLDAVLEPTKKAVLEAKAKYSAMGLEGDAFEKAIAAGGHSVLSLKSQLEAFAMQGGSLREHRQQPLYNLSEFTSKLQFLSLGGVLTNSTSTCTFFN